MLVQQKWKHSNPNRTTDVLLTAVSFEDERILAAIVRAFMEHASISIEFEDRVFEFSFQNTRDVTNNGEDEQAI